VDTCNATRKDGTPCKARAQPNVPYCWGHDPTLTEKRREKRAKGGANKATISRLGKRMPATLRPVLDTLYGALTGLEDGTTDPKTATAMASVAGAIMRLYEGSELEGRLATLEAAGEKRQARSGRGRERS